MYAMRSLCVDGGAPISFKNMYQLARVYNGIKKHHGVTSTRVRLPITLGILQSMYTCLSMGAHDDIILWAAFTLAVSNMLRVSEFAITRSGQYPAPITHADIDMNISSQYYQLRIKKSKTDQYAEGRTIQVFATGAVTCPVHAMWRLMSLFPRPRPQSTVFQLRSGVPLSRHVVERRLKSLVKSIGLDPSQYNTHSLRRGGATTYSLANVSDRMIQVIGGWASDSYKLYIDTSIGQVREAAISASRVSSWFGALPMSLALSQQRSVSEIGLFD